MFVGWGGGQHSYGWHHPTHKALPHSSILSAWLTPHYQWHPSPPSFLSSFSFFLSIPPPPRVGTACFCRQCCLLLASLLLLRHAIGDCFLLAPWRGPIRRGRLSNHWAECLTRHRLSQSEWLVARHPEVKGEGERKIPANEEAAPTAARHFRLPPNRQGVNTITHTHTH